MLSEGASDEELAAYAPYPPARGLDPAIQLPDGPYRPGQRYWPVALPWPFRDSVGIPRLPYPPGPVPATLEEAVQEYVVAVPEAAVPGGPTEALVRVQVALGEDVYRDIPFHTPPSSGQSPPPPPPSGESRLWSDEQPWVVLERAHRERTSFYRQQDDQFAYPDATDDSDSSQGLGVRVRSLSRRIARSSGNVVNFRYLSDEEAREMWIRLREILRLNDPMPGRADHSLERCTNTSEQDRVFAVQQEREDLRLANHRRWTMFWTNTHSRWVSAMLDILVVTGQSGQLVDEIRR
jgi:hypothetical protein